MLSISQSGFCRHPILFNSFLFYKYFLAIYNIQAFLGVHDLATIKVVLQALTMASFHNPSGITCGYTTLDEMLPALSKLFTTLFYKYFLAIYNIQAFLWIHYLATIKVVNSFQISVFTFHIVNTGIIHLGNNEFTPR